MYGIGHTTYCNALNAAKAWAADLSAVNYLSSGSSGAATGLNTVLITHSACGALGLACGSDVGSTIGINLALIDSDRSNGIAAGPYDRQAVVLHEIDEMLGVGRAGSRLGRPSPAFGGPRHGPLQPRQRAHFFDHRRQQRRWLDQRRHDAAGAFQHRVRRGLQSTRRPRFKTPTAPRVCGSTWAWPRSLHATWWAGRRPAR